MRSSAIVFGIVVGVLCSCHFAYAARDDGVPSNPPATPAKERPAPGSDARELLQTGYALFDKNDIAGAYAALADAVASPGFGLLDAQEQYHGLAVAGAVAVQHHQYAPALTVLKRATAYAQADGEDWNARLIAAFAVQDYADAAASLTTIAQYWPKTFAGTRSRGVYAILKAQQDASADGPATYALLSSLFDAGWTLEGVEPSWAWLDLATLLIENDHVDGARRVASRIAAPRALLAMRVDKRFDTVAPAESATVQVERAQKNEIEFLRRRMQERTKNLEAIYDYQSALLSAHECAPALTVSDEVIARVLAGKGDELYDDFASDYQWMLDARAQALNCLGRYDEGVAQMIDASRYSENSGNNVSQAINLGNLHAVLGHADEAEKALSTLGALSPFGRMQLEKVKVLIAVDRKDEKAFDEPLAYLREHRAVSMAAYQDGLIDSNRLDAAAELLIERLRNPTFRGEALVACQQYVQDSPLPRTQEDERRLQAVVARADVQRELLHVGRIERFTIPR